MEMSLEGKQRQKFLWK